MAQKKTSKFERILVLVTTIVIGSLITIDTLTTGFTDNNNVLTITGHFKKVYKSRPARGSLNYSLYIHENENVYQIGADDAGCFTYDNFINEISDNDPIKISIRKKNSFFRNSDLLSVVTVEVNGSRYLDPVCINDNLKSNRTLLPLFSLALMIGGFLFYKYKR